MSLKDIGELKDSIKILKDFSNVEDILNSDISELGNSAFDNIKFSLEDLAPEDAVKKLNAMKLDSNLSKEIMDAADSGKLLKGSADEVSTAIQGIGSTVPAVSGLTSVFKGLMATLATNPLTWIAGLIATLGVATKIHDSIIDKNEELARERLVGLDEKIASYDNEISSLKTLQSQLQSAEGNITALVSINERLNSIIGTTTGLIEGESKAYDIANAKLTANIALKEQQQEQLKKEKADASKELFDSNVFEDDLLGVDWLAPDKSADKMRSYAKIYSEAVNNYNSLSDDDKVKKRFKDANEYALSLMATIYDLEFQDEDWASYWNEQVQIAYDAFDGYIQDYEGAGGQNFIKNLINNLVRGGADFSEISKVVQEVTNNEEMQNAINSYWESLVNPDMDSEKSAKEIKDVFNRVTQSFPSLESFFTQFYNDIISGGDGAYVSLLGVSNATTALATSVDKLQSASSGISSLSKAFQELSDDSRISIDTISGIKDAVGDSIPNWEHYQTQLLNVKAGSSEFNQILSELTYAVLKEQLGVEGLANATEDEIASILNENGVLNASAVAHDIATQKTKELADTKAQEYMKTQDNITVTSDNIESLITQATAAGVSTNAYLQLLAKQILFDNTGIDTSSKCAQILAIANAANIATVQIGTLDTEIQTVAGKKVGSGARTAYAESKGVKVIAEKNRTDKNAKGNGNLYIVGDKEFEDFEDAMYYAEAYNTQQKIANLTPQITLPEYSLNSTSASQTFKESFNWIDTALSRVQRAVNNFGKTVAATWQSWKVRNAALKDQMSAIRNEISLQDQAYSKYTTLADSVGLSEGYKTLVRDGAIDISTIKSESIAEAIKLYQEYYEKALAAKDASADLKDELAALAQTKFSNLAQSFADLMSGNDHTISMYEATIDLMEKRGYTASASLYDSLKEAELKNQDILKEKYQSLSQALDEAVNSGAVIKYSEQWYQMQNEILAVEEAILQSNIALAEYDLSLRDLEWSAFDKLHEEISEIYEETEFLDKLLSDKKKFNEDGSMTEAGQAALGLGVVNYKTHLAQAEEYAQELERIKEALAKDPYNQTLLDRQDELEEKHREVLTNIEDDEQSMIDTVSEGYDILLDHMDKMIDKRKNMLSQAKDLYEYEKNISQQTKEIASLEKQLAAYQGDDSEEARATIQKLQVSLSEAKDNLEETEYDKYISDQEEMLDTLRLQTEEWINRRLDNEDQLLKDIVSSTERNATSIKETLSKATSDAGTALSSTMTSIWSSDGEIGSAITQIKDYLAGMQKNADEKAKEQGQNNTSASSDSGSTPATAPTSFTPPTTSAPKWGDFFIKKYDSHTKNELNTETSIVDRLKYFDIDSDFKARRAYYTAMGGSGIYTGSYAQNSWMISQMKSNGYARGGFIGDMIRATGEDGIALVRRGEGIIPTNMVPEWNALIHHLPQLNNSMLGSIPQHETNVSIDIGDIQMYGVNDPEAFAHQLKQAMLNNNSIRNIMKDTTIGEALGRNSMTRYTR